MIRSLIIKSSCCKLPNGELKSDYGDLIRSSVLLRCIDNNFIWLTDKRSIKLLERFINGKHLIAFDDDIERISFPHSVDIYNIDNHVSNKSLFKKLRGRWHGFIWDGGNDVFPDNTKIADTAPYLIIQDRYSWQQALIEGMGFQWNRQDYPEISIPAEIIADVGLNWHVHPDWKSKQWSKEDWGKLGTLLSKTCSISWQKGLNDIGRYIEWLSSCSIIVTNDSLGLHLSSALRKQVVVIMGPTDSREFPYNRVTFIRPDNYEECMPCNAPVCKLGENCLNKIIPERVTEVIARILKK